MQLDPAAQLALRLALAWLLLTAAVHKLGHLEAFRDAVEGYRLVPSGASGAIARGSAAAELATGLALLWPASAGPAAVVAALLFGVYGVAIAVNLTRGRRHIDCGCGAGRRQPLSEGLVARNAVLVLVAGLAALASFPRPWVWIDALTTAGGALTLGLLYAAVDGALAQAPALAALRRRAWSTR
jgi:uncharacterized membrane protein YphA (DoxX/SURF4 family)